MPKLSKPNPNNKNLYDNCPTHNYIMNKEQIEQEIKYCVKKLKKFNFLTLSTAKYKEFLEQELKNLKEEEKPQIEYKTPLIINAVCLEHNMVRAYYDGIGVVCMICAGLGYSYPDKEGE